MVVTSETVQVLFNFRPHERKGLSFLAMPAVTAIPVAESGSGPFSGSFTIISN